MPAPTVASRDAARRRRRGERGQSIIELALTMPVLFLLLLGIVEFGHALNSYLTVLASARDSARFAAGGGASEALLKELIANETERLPNGAVSVNNTCTNPDGGICVVGIDATGASNNACTRPATGTAAANPCVSVKVCYPHQMIVGIPFFTDDRELRLCSQTVMRLADP